MASQSEQRFSTRWGLLLSVLGIAVGTGNIWRFPRIAATQSGTEGAGAFLVAWVVGLLIWSLPLIIAEYALGRMGRMGVVGTFSKIAGERFAWMGAFAGFVATAIMFYYSVVTGWAFFYFLEMLTSPLPLAQEAAVGVWQSFQAGYTPVLFHALAMGLGGWIIYKGVSAIERISKALLPALFVILLLALLRTFTLEGAWEGVVFLFTPQWETLLRPEVWLGAITQNAWDTGAGWCLILTYAAYMQTRHGVVKNALITGVANNTVSIVAGTIIFGIVFATLGAEMTQGQVLAVMQESGPAASGLTFIWLPKLFEAMPLGRIIAVLFFLGLSFAAFTSLVSMIELAPRTFVAAGVTRHKAVGGVCAVGFLLGLPSALSVEFLASQDFVWAVGLVISGAFVAFAVVRYGPARIRTGMLKGSFADWDPGRMWEVLIGVLVPVQAVALLGWWLWQSATVYAPETWYDPFVAYSVMNCLVQWGLALVVFLALNRWMVRRTLGRPLAETERR